MTVFNKAMTSVMIIFIFSLLASIPKAAASSSVPNASTIAGVEVGGLTYAEAEEKLKKEVDIWLNGEPIKSESHDEAIFIPRDSFQFDIDQTLKELEQHTKRPWYLFFLKPESSQLPLLVQVNKESHIEWPSYVNAEATLEKAKEEAAYLTSQPVSIVYKEDNKVKKKLVAEVEFTIPDMKSVEVEYMADQINGQMIGTESQFSFIDSVLKEVRPTASMEGASFFASAFYALSLKTNMEIIERHSQGIIPDYTEAGIEAKVNETEKKDLILLNPNHYSYTIAAKVEKSKLHISLNSVAKETTYDYRVENENEVKPRTLYRFSHKLSPGSRVPMESGQKGMQVEIYRLHLVDGKVKEEKLVSKDFYPPTPTVFLVSSQEPPEVIETLTEKNESSLIDSEAHTEEATDEQNNEIDRKKLDSDTSIEILKTVNQAACQQMDDGPKQMCEKIIIESDLMKNHRNETENNETTDVEK